jgi:hypothetical protein
MYTYTLPSPLWGRVRGTVVPLWYSTSMDWIVDVWTADHDTWKGAGVGAVRTRMVISHTAYPTYASALDVAACMAVALRGGMPIHTMRVR